MLQLPKKNYEQKFRVPTAFSSKVYNMNVGQDHQDLVQAFQARGFSANKTIPRLSSASQLMMSLLQDNEKKNMKAGEAHLSMMFGERQHHQRIVQTLQMQLLASPKIHPNGRKLRFAYQFLSNPQNGVEMKQTKTVAFGNKNILQQHRAFVQPVEKQNFDASNANPATFKRTHDQLIHFQAQMKEKETIQNKTKSTKVLNGEQKHQVSTHLIQKRKFDQKNFKLCANLHPFVPNPLQQSQPKKRKKRAKGAKRLTKWWYEPKMREKMNNAIAAVRVDDQSLQLVSARHNIPPRTLSRYVKASFQPESPFYVGRDKWRSKPFKIGQIRTCIAAMNVDGLGIQKASALYNVPHFALTRYLKESRECRESPFYFEPAPPTSKHSAYLDKMKEAIRCHRSGFYGGTSLGQLLSLLYEDGIDQPGVVHGDDGRPKDGGPAMLRPLLVMVESLPEILTNVLLTLRFYIFKAEAIEKAGVPSADEGSVAKPWLRTAPSVFGPSHGTILNDVVATILVAMRKHTSRAPIQILCLETLDKLSSSLLDVGLFGNRPDGSRYLACGVIASYGLLTAEESAVITAMAAHSAKMKYGICSLQDLRRVEAGPLDLNCAYPCNDASTRRFFGAGWAGHPSIYSRWADKEYESTKPANPLQTQQAPQQLSVEVGNMARLQPPMASNPLADKYRSCGGSDVPGNQSGKKQDTPLRQLALICCASSPDQKVDSKTNDVGFVCV